MARPIQEIIDDIRSNPNPAMRVRAMHDLLKLDRRGGLRSDAHQAMSDERMSALHFAVYYNLLLNEPTDKPLPELWRSPLDRKGTGMMGPLFCPPAQFTRQ